MFLSAEDATPTVTPPARSAGDDTPTVTSPARSARDDTPTVTSPAGLNTIMSFIDSSSFEVLCRCEGSVLPVHLVVPTAPTVMATPTGSGITLITSEVVLTAPPPPVCPVCQPSTGRRKYRPYSHFPTEGWIRMFSGGPESPSRAKPMQAFSVGRRWTVHHQWGLEFITDPGG